MRVCRAVYTASQHDLEPRGCGGHGAGLREDGDDAVLAAGVLRIGIVHVRLGVANDGRVVKEMLLDHHVHLRLIETEAMLDRVAAGDDRILLTFPAVHVTAGFLPQPVRLVDERLQHRQRIRHLILILPVRRKRITSGREQLDPVGAAGDLLLHGGPRLFNRSYDGARQWIGRTRGIRRLRAPHNAERRDLVSRTVEASFVDCVANLDVAVPIAVRAHVTSRGESGTEIGQRVLHGHQHGGLGRALRGPLVEHVRMRIDQPG